MKYRIYQSRDEYIDDKCFIAQKLVKGFFRTKWKHLKIIDYKNGIKLPMRHVNIDNAIKEIVEHVRYDILPEFEVIQEFTQEEIESLL
tara:strand:- start:12369 stop:12632 length:264 start_codon:yes stop_codon:yes gene_type:complete